MKASSFLRRQGLISSIATLLLLILSLLFVNFQIRILGLHQYGLIVLLLSVFGTINLLNVGAGNALVGYYTRFGTDKSVFWSIYTLLFLVILTLSLTVLGVCSIFYESIFIFLGIDNNNLNIMTYWGAAMIGTSRLLSSISTSYWVAKVDFLKLKIFGFFNIYFPISILLISYNISNSINESLFYAGSANITFIIVFTIYLLISKINPKELKLMHHTTLHGKQFMINGFQFQGISIIGSISIPIVNTLLTNNLGLQAVSYFDIALKLLNSGRQIIVSATEPFFGKMTQLHQQNKYRLMQLLVIKHTKQLTIIAILYFIANLVLAKFILTLWVGEDIAQATYKATNIIAFGLITNIATAVIYYYFLAIKIDRKYILYTQLISLLLYILPFMFSIKSLEEYAYYYSLSYFISSLYLFTIFYFKKRSKQ